MIASPTMKTCRRPSRSVKLAHWEVEQQPTKAVQGDRRANRAGGAAKRLDKERQNRYHHPEAELIDQSDQTDPNEDTGSLGGYR